ncbi:MFS transporter [Actinomadura mexicana]|uniref:Tetracycline resistance protein n=1 Tax=Actinomadura mexicana TaxID=134959 RepID=A0A238VY31_9ACTN|nr:MFS transporter [Actinomadura mexicana]SNR38763.1 Major Facilitator Superfamily protein [Actinomadura mexicana]
MRTPSTTPSAARTGAPDRPGSAGRGVPAAWLALLAGPLSFGIAGPSLILPDAARDLALSLGAVTWIVTAFGWAIAIGTPLMAGLQSHQGVRRALLACAALVALGASLVVVAPSLPMLVLGSAAQGLGTAGFTTIAMSLTRSARALGLVTASLATVGSTAPLVADLAGELLSWQAGLALPALSLLAVPGVLRHRPSGPAPDAPFDPVGAVLLAALVSALVAVPHSWRPAGAAAVAAGGLLALHLRSRRDGFVPASIVRAPVFFVASGLAFLLAATNFGMIYLLPALLAEQADWSSGQVGAAILWPLLLGGLGSYGMIAATAKAPLKAVAVLFPGLAAVGAGLACLSFSPAVLLIAQAFTSLAAASGQGVFAARGADAVPEGARSTAMGQFNLFYLLGAAFGPAIASALAG